jgi:hypothetical protein
VILSSANLTATARDASRQTNYAWFADLPQGHPWLTQVLRDYEAHAKRCSVFLGDLLSLIREASGTPRRQVIEAWLTGAAPTNAETESTKMLGDITEWALDPARRDQATYSVRLPEASPTRKQAERLVTKLGGAAAGDEIRVDRSAFLTHVEQTLRVPLMMVDAQRKAIRIAVAGELRDVTIASVDPAAVNRALGHLEAYVRTVDWGEALDPLYAKTAMYEAALYMLAAPFANEQMKVLRRRHGALERRGPRMLYLVGPSSNGKTTFLRFALFLLTGRHIRPLPAADLTKSKVQHAIMLRTCFPLVFDDVNPTQRPAFEEILKSYWATWWSADGVSPQLVMSSNNPALHEWAKTRVLRIDFDVHFAPSESNSAKLAQLFDQPSELFPSFASLYLENLPRLEEPRDDELFLARDVMRELYRGAKRELPRFFPQKPLEELYDPGRMRWLDLLERSKQATERRDRDRLIVEFSEDLQHHEIKRYVALLPQTVKAEPRGKKLIIDNPAEFGRWLRRERQTPVGRLVSLFRGRKA